MCGIGNFKCFTNYAICIPETSPPICDIFTLETLDIYTTLKIQTQANLRFNGVIEAGMRLRCLYFHFFKFYVKQTETPSGKIWY